MNVAFVTAQKELGVNPLFLPEDTASEAGEGRSILLYLSLLRNAIHKRERERQKQKEKALKAETEKESTYIDRAPLTLGLEMDDEEDSGAHTKTFM